MKILKDLIEKSKDTLEEIEWYSEKALHLKGEHRNLADAYIEIAEAHVKVYTKLHEQMVMLIEEEKKKGTQIPVTMSVIWDYEHEKLIKEFAEAKYLIEEYKKNY